MGDLAILNGSAPARPSVNLIEVARQAEAARALGATLIASGLLPDTIRKPEQAMAIMIKGAELDLPPMYALSHIVIIQGKPAMSAEAMSALVHRAGHVLRVVETTPERAVVEGIRRDDPGHTVRVEFTEEDARRAGLAGKGGHKTYPAALKLARAKSALCRAAFSEAIAGISYVPEELGAEVNGEGEVLSVPDRPEAPQRAEEPVEKAEVVDDDGPSSEHQEVLDELARTERAIPFDMRPDSTQLWNYASAKIGNARQALQKLEGILDGVAQTADEKAPGARDEEEAVPDFDDMRGAARDAPRPARKSQKDLIRTLAVELAGVEDGAERLEERRGIRIDDLTLDEANALLEELSPQDG